MTGILGAISPGSDVQLASGIVMTFAGTMVYVGFMPFLEAKDNVLGVLTNAQIFLVMLTAMVLKHNETDGEEGVGALLIILNAICGLIFVWLGLVEASLHKKDYDDNAKGEAAQALDVVIGELGGSREGGKETKEDVELVERPLMVKKGTVI